MEGVEYMNTKEKLIILTSGESILPSKVAAIRLGKHHETTSLSPIKDRVLIDYSVSDKQNTIVIEFEYFDDAKKYALQLADIINVELDGDRQQ